MTDIGQNLHQSNQVTFFNIIPSPRDDRDVNVDMIFDPPYKFPRTLDYTRYLQEVRNQGVQGTSLAQVGACMVEWRERKINKNGVQLSPQFLYNSREDKKLNLMCGRELMKLLVNKGCCTEKVCPYGTQENTEEMSGDAEKYRVKGYARIQTMDTLKTSLVMFGPCLITFPVYNHTSYMWKQHKDEQKLGGHAMTIIGYNYKGFILRNTWGKYWENQGYCVYPYEDWGYHDEVWTMATEEYYDAWKNKGTNKLLKRLSFKSKPSVKKDDVENDSNVQKVTEKTDTVEQKEEIKIDLPKPRSTTSSKKENKEEDKEVKKKKSMFSTFFKSQKKKEEPKVDESMKEESAKEEPKKEESAEKAESSPKKEDESITNTFDNDETVPVTTNPING